MKLPLLIVVPILAVLLLCGWFLLPSEDEPVTLAVLDPSNADSYRVSYAVRGDLELNANITCRFRSLQQERLRFPYSGRVVGEAYVEVGDDVVPGQLLVELENEELDDQLEAAEDEAERLRQDLEFARIDLEIVRDSYDMYNQVEDYEKVVTRLEEDSALADKRLEELRARKQSECLYAGIEGTVTYVREYKISNTESDCIVISDRGDACFYADTEHYQSLPSGTEVTLSTDEGDVLAVVKTAADLGFEEPASLGTDKRRLYFVPKSTTTMMNDNSRASLRLLLDSRKDVLIISESAVLFAGGQAYVFRENENGNYESRPVELGLRVSGRYEVLSGLQEGDALVVR